MKVSTIVGINNILVLQHKDGYTGFVASVTILMAENNRAFFKIPDLFACDSVESEVGYFIMDGFSYKESIFLN